MLFCFSDATLKRLSEFAVKHPQFFGERNFQTFPLRHGDSLCLHPECLYKKEESSSKRAKAKRHRSKHATSCIITANFIVTLKLVIVVVAAAEFNDA